MSAPVIRQSSLAGYVPPLQRGHSQQNRETRTVSTGSANVVRLVSNYSPGRGDQVLPSYTGNYNTQRPHRGRGIPTYHSNYHDFPGKGTHMSNNSNSDHNHNNISNGTSMGGMNERLPNVRSVLRSRRAFSSHIAVYRTPFKPGESREATGQNILPSPSMMNHSALSSTTTTTTTSLAPTPSPVTNAIEGRIEPIPLRNFGNTCYLNATLQCVLQTPWLLSSLAESHIEVRRQPATAALLELSKSNTSNPGQLLLTIKNEAAKRNDEFADNGQSDAHEFLRTFLFVVHSENNRGSGENTPYEELKDIENEDETSAMQRWCEHLLRVDNSVVYDLFGGVMRSKCVCDSCGKMSLTFDPFLDLSLPMKYSFSSFSPSSSFSLPAALVSSKKPISIESLLGANFNDVEEKLRGGNQLLCTRCKRLRNGTRSVKVTQWPKILVLQLKRFDHTGRKNGASVAYPESFTTCGENGKRYQLYGVVCHQGTECWGHYTSYVCVSSTGEWFLCSDATITPTSARTAMDALSKAYMIFYAEKT
ncbi:Peptidase C19 [Trypanosoma melophagium]|uniref:Peptidase C19 n=1 Tax=Trypanosoma melophagium TaxID=715481 RepID=UPI00351A9CBE|nr:Peptidase C19 [Trypanosoma melophagium]